MEIAFRALIKILKFVSRFYVYVYPVFLCLLALYPPIVESTLRFINILKSKESVFRYPLDWPVFIIWIVTILWSILGVFSELKRDKQEEKKFKGLEAALLGAPNFRSFSKARAYLNDATATLRAVDKFELEYKAGNFTNIERIVVHLMALNIMTRKIIADFFDIDPSNIGVNYMVYIGKGDDADTDKAIDKLLTKNPLYHRPHKSDHLLGVLYLRSELRDGIPSENKKTKLEDVVMPIYRLESRVYNAPECLLDDITLPGAPMAFFRENSIIGNTKDEKIYANFDRLSKDEVLGYFTGKAVEIRSLASFSIPDDLGQNNCVGIFNVESSRTSTFERNERYFSTLYTMLYPGLMVASKYLVYYKNYLVHELSLSDTDKGE
jgi:hypothetical protein